MKKPEEFHINNDPKYGVGLTSNKTEGGLTLIKKEDYDTLEVKYNKLVEYLKEEAYLMFTYRDYMHTDGENSIEGARNILIEVDELNRDDLNE